MQQNSKSAINAKYQGRGGGFLFWSVETNTNLIQQDHYSIHSSCRENIYSGEVLSQGITSEEAVLATKVFLTGFSIQTTVICWLLSLGHRAFNVSINSLNILKKISPFIKK